MSGIEWIMRNSDRETAEELAEMCELPRPVARILASRGFTDKDECLTFIEKNPKLIRNPSSLPDCEPAVQRLKKAIEDHEKIFVWGDYDVDGITATAIVVICLRLFGADLSYKVPTRIDDGYDIRRHSIDECLAADSRLLMSVDCGIVAFDTAEYAIEKGVDLIITDHHSPSDDGKIPKALAVVNPSRHDSEYGFSGLCGAGVAFKLMMSLGKALQFDLNTIIRETIELVALGTVADVAPMEDENRILVDRGCRILGNSSKPGIQALMKIAGAKEVDTTTIGFQLGPRINAIGRLSDPMIALELMLETGEQRSKYLAMQLDTANKRRQSKQEHMLNEALSMVEDEKLYEMPAIVCWAKSWHSGLIGLVAGKLAEKYHRPAIVLSVNDEGNAKGSCRSTKTVNILSVLKHPRVLDLYSKKIDGKPIVGGHAFAAGMEVPFKNLEKYREKICDTLVELYPDFIPGKRIFFADARIVAGEVNDETFDALQGLAPFGAGNPEPVFWLRNMLVQDQKLMSNDKHMKLILSNDRLKYKRISAILWHKAGDYANDYVDKKIDLLFTFGKEARQFGSKFFLNIVDIRESE